MGLSAVKLMQVRMPKQSKLSYKIDGHCINVKSPTYILLTNEIQFFFLSFFLYRNSLIKMKLICVIILYFEIVEKEKKPLEQLYKVSYKCFLVRNNLNTFLMNLNFLNLYPL